MWTVLRGHGDAENKKINVAALKTYIPHFVLAATATRAGHTVTISTLQCPVKGVCRLI